MSQKWKIVCDNCNKEADIDEEDNTENGWFWNPTFHLCWMNPITKKGKNVHEIKIRDERDPDFCSEDCALEWYKKQLKEIKKEKHRR